MQGRKTEIKLTPAGSIVFPKELNSHVLPNEPLFSSLYIRSLKALILASPPTLPLLLNLHLTLAF